MHEDAGDRCERTETVTVPKPQLEQLERLASLGAVASSVAHEFNNILTSILNHAKLGMRGTDAESMQQSFEKILKSSRRAAKITTGMLALSRNRTARMEPTDVVAIVEEVLAVVEKDLSVHKIKLERKFEATPRIRAVSWQIEQVLLNLIINARQAMPKGGTLTVGIHSNMQAGMAEISIRDTGEGIESKRLAKIFDPFFSTKQGPDASGQGGSGLGLSVCRDIIERHQGRIRVESLLRHGTTFTIKLPLAEQVTLVPAA